MDTSMLVIMMISWITKKFPSLQQYTEYAVPIAISIATAFGIFTNLLPKPGHHFPVPDTTELENELQGGGKLILKFAKFTRSIVIMINWFLSTIVYKWFYDITNMISVILPKFKKKTAK